MYKLLATLTVIVILVAGSVVIYYYLDFLPKENKVAALEKNKEECLHLQQTVLNNYEQEYGSSLSQATIRNHYNQQLQKCFVEIQDVDESSNSNRIMFDTWYYVYDAVEDNPLIDCLVPSVNGAMATCTQNPQADGGGNEISKTQFDQLESSYMSN